VAKTSRLPAIDSLVNSSFLNGNDSSALGHLIKDLASRPPIVTPEDLLEQLEANDIRAAVLSIMDPAHAEWVGEAHKRYPRRILPAMIVDPTKGMPEIRRVIEYHGRYGVRCLRIPPFRYSLPPTDRIYWPFYAKAVELDIPVSMNAGMPGPRRPGSVQNPIHYDDVAYHFPELRIIMTHCGQPWTDEAISVMAHWDNVFMSACAVAPQYWPEALVQFINTRGKDKMLFGTEYPTIAWDRARHELDERGIRDSVAPLFFSENAKRVYKWDADLG
jgi:predicted TIM-barrel fold metal-dependent hydrolase